MAPPPSIRHPRFSDGVPAKPPAFVLAEVAAAHLRMEQLAAVGVAVEFHTDAATGGLAIDLRSRRGERRLKPSDVFALLES